MDFGYLKPLSVIQLLLEKKKISPNVTCKDLVKNRDQDREM